ncbi:MAG: hypothetical protein ACXWUG_18995 [Polyangiales bacterium]
MQAVSGTSIFARAIDPVRQALVYEMSLAADGDLAMVLPIPVMARAAEDAVRFVSLKAYPRFFRDMENAFPPEAMARFAPQARGEQALAPAPLVVHDVGDFDASFVPTAADFSRLDPRFRLPEKTLRALTGYDDWGFAVFKLKVGQKGKKQYHPMAFTFPRRDPRRLFFPTLHIHDGEVHSTAHFDHALYAQWQSAPKGWTSSAMAASSVIDDARAEGLVEPMALLHRLEIRSEQPNKDIWVE